MQKARPYLGSIKGGQLTFPSFMQLNVLTSCDKISLYAILGQKKKNMSKTVFFLKTFVKCRFNYMYSIHNNVQRLSATEPKLVGGEKNIFFVKLYFCF